MTGEFPPQYGGVSDYTLSLATALQASGDSVHVIAPGSVAAVTMMGAVHVHRLSDHYGRAGCAELKEILRTLPAPHRVFVQFVPQSFGWRGVNLPFGFLLTGLRKYPLWVMFHEFAISDNPHARLPSRLLALGTRLFAGMVARSAERCFISTTAWREVISRVAPRAVIVDLPVPSNIPTSCDDENVTALSRRFRHASDSQLVGHFGTYRMRETAELLRNVVVDLCISEPTRHVLLMGRESDNFCQEIVYARPELAGRVFGTGGLEPQALADHLCACDVVFQPYEDGVTSRRGSLIAALAIGVPIVTTRGRATEAFWDAADAVSIAESFESGTVTARVEKLLADPTSRRALSVNARTLYRSHFDLLHTVDTLKTS